MQTKTRLVSHVRVARPIQVLLSDLEHSFLREVRSALRDAAGWRSLRTMSERASDDMAQTIPHEMKKLTG